ncbi:MAG: hypothetical protein LBM98_04600 [Oscillospiraceae bacterium]|nr:hypothetical protein [Oscillospiraceae bacterium]
MSSFPALRNDELLTHVHLHVHSHATNAQTPVRNQRPNLRPLSPLWRGAAAAAGWSQPTSNPPVPFPSWEGCRPQAAGWSSPTSYPPKPPSSEGGAAAAAGGATGVTGEGGSRAAGLDGGTGLLRPAGRAMSIRT